MATIELMTMHRGITLYGITNCDTVKRARAWLKEHNVAYTFHDFKKAGVPEKELKAWFDALGWERLVNRQGTTWRKLEDSTKAKVVDADSAAALMSSQASVIKRPVVQWADGGTTVGFDTAEWQRRLTRPA